VEGPNERSEEQSRLEVRSHQPSLPSPVTQHTDVPAGFHPFDRVSDVNILVYGMVSSPQDVQHLTSMGRKEA
jgi:hypothetical protein